MVGQGRKQAEGLGGQTRGLQSSVEDTLVRLGEGRTWSWALQVEVSGLGAEKAVGIPELDREHDGTRSQSLLCSLRTPRPLGL